MPGTDLGEDTSGLGETTGELSRERLGALGVVCTLGEGEGAVTVVLGAGAIV